MNWFSMMTVWFLYLFTVGIIFLPLTTRIFSSFVDKGYPFSKTIGIVCVTYVVFLAGILHIMPFTQESILFILIFLSIAIYKLFGNSLREFKKLSWQQWCIIAAEEIVFFIALLFLTFVRGQEGSIHGLEKFMDYGFMQSILKSRYFPPLDMWLSADPSHPNGYPINYYYFGHLSGALLIKLSGTIPTVGYNLILATIFSQAVTLSFSWTMNAVALTRAYWKKQISYWQPVLFGVLGSFLVNFAGNLHTIYIFTKGYENDKPLPICSSLTNWMFSFSRLFSQVNCTPFQSMQEIRATMFTNKTDFFAAMVANSKYWYPNATRFIEYTIHEFPSYSYVVADLHGHVFDIPFVLTLLGLILLFFTSHLSRAILTTTAQSKKSVSKETYSLTRSVRLMFHTYGIMIDDILWSIVFGFSIAVHYMTNAFDGPIYLLFLIVIFIFVYRFRIAAIFHILLTAGSYAVFSFPFSHFFKPFVSGIGVNCSPDFLVKYAKIGPFLFEKGNCQTSPFWMLFTLWGFFLVSYVLYLISLWFPKIKNHVIVSPVDRLMHIVFLFGFFLLTIPEFFYIKDIYPTHFRANTMFKLGYQAYIMMSLGSAYLFYRIISSTVKKAAIPIAFCYLSMVALIGVYSFLAFPSYYPGLNDMTALGKKPEIDGEVWLQNQYPADHELIQFINSQIQGQPVILEAQGDSYTDFNKISAYTGTPTIAGWWVHEWLWRGSSDVVGMRIPDIVNIYESDDVDMTRTLLKKYRVEYVIVSRTEREKYTKLNLKKFSSIGYKIFETSDKSGALYKVF